MIAGYPAEVRETLDLNPGLRDRFGYRVEFPDYSTDQLVQIFCRMAGDRGFTVACVDALPGSMEALRRSAGFSNARTARKLVDHAVVEASWARDEAVITADDLECALPQCLGAPPRGVLGVGGAPGLARPRGQAPGPTLAPFPLGSWPRFCSGRDPVVVLVAGPAPVSGWVAAPNSDVTYIPREVLLANRRFTRRTAWNVC